MFPKMSTKDRLVGWAAMFIWGAVALSPLGICRLFMDSGILGALLGPTVGLVLTLSGGFVCGAWCWKICMIGFELVTKIPIAPVIYGDRMAIALAIMAAVGGDKINGYEISKRIRIAFVTDTALAEFYSVLHDMVDSGWLIVDQGLTKGRDNQERIQYLYSRGEKMYTPPMKRGFYPGESQPWKHGGDW